MRRNAALLGAFVLAIGATSLLVFLLGDRRSGQERTRSPVDPVPTTDPSSTLSGEPKDASELGRSAPASAQAAAAAPVAAGVLRLEFVSALDGTPVADLPFLVYRERGGRKDLARGRSDARGRAEVRDLEENVILVLNARHPPFAAKVGACWLGRAETKDLVVRLDGGARVVGRVVDDERRPVEGAEILAAADYVEHSPSDVLDRIESATVTGADGRFAIDHLAYTPSGVWVVDGEARPENWHPPVLHARKDASVVFISAEVKPGDTLDVGDVVLPRSSILSGVVLDPEGRPLPHALVSCRSERRFARYHDGRDPLGFRIAPDAPGFRLHPGETLTDAGGRFELWAAMRDSGLSVWAPSGQRQFFATPALAPGERRDDLELKLHAVSMLEIELRNAKGERVTKRGPASREDVFRISHGAPRSSGELLVEFRLHDDTRKWGRSAADVDGIFRFEVETSLSRLRGLNLDLAGYRKVHDEFDGAIAPSTRLTYVLEEIPAIHLLLRRRNEGDGFESRRLMLQTCLASPERRRDQTVWWPCCGLGASTSFDWTGEPREFVFPAEEPRAYWVYLRGHDAQRGMVDLASFGPFEAREQFHEIEIDPSLLQGLFPEETRAPPERSEPGEAPRRAFLSLRVVNARTDEPILGAAIRGTGTSQSERPIWFPTLRTGTEGRIERAEIPPGAWKIFVHAEAHHTVERDGLVLVEDGAMDLGTIALEPRSPFRGRVLQADGSPAPRESWVRPILDTAPAALTDEAGRFLLDGDLAENVVLVVSEPFDAANPGLLGSQRVLVEGWRNEIEQEIRLASWQQVEIRIRGPANDLPGTSLQVRACVACEHREIPSPGHAALLHGREIDPLPEERVFRFRMAPGRYQIYGGDLMHEVPLQTIEVSDSPELQVFELSSR